MKAIRSRQPAMTLMPNGRIRVSAYAAKALDLESGDALNIWQEDGEYYLYAVHRPKGKYACTVRPTNLQARRSYICFSVELYRYVHGIMGARECRVAAGDTRDLTVGKGLTLIMRDIC